jgi:hypothetical protein
MDALRGFMRRRFAITEDHVHNPPMTMAARYKALAVFACPDTMVVGSNLTGFMDVSVVMCV